MVLAPGARLGPYQISSQLGSGGMGVAYRAHDPRLRRDVAIKVLLVPAPELALRFEREARAAGMLSHPNVVAVFDVGQHDGAPYVVSELLEGETLRARLGRGALPVREALQVAVAVARGLAAAHEKGIVHRDLKPENVFLTQDKQVKILDFGIAKLTRDEGSASSPEGDSTLSLATEAGAILGTADYMAPEQARGVAVDHRADLFALGVLLYEMVAGKRPFGGASRLDRMMAIVKDAPAELPAEVAALAPPGLQALLTRCLAKEPGERYQSARDLAFQLETLPTTVGKQVTQEARPRRWWVAGVVGAVVLAGAAAWWLTRDPSTRPSTSTSTSTSTRPSTNTSTSPSTLASSTAPLFKRLTFRSGSLSAARFAPDGHSVVYGAAWGADPLRLHTTSTDGPSSRTLELPPGDLFAISRTGELAVALARRRYWWAGEGTLARAPLVGGAPRSILEQVQAADWATDGDSLAVARRVDGRFRIEYPIGNILHETDGWVSQLRISPDGLRVAFLDHPFVNDDRGNLAVVDLAGKRRVLSSDWGTLQGLAWRDAGEIWFSAAQGGAPLAVYAVTLEAKQRLVLRGAGALRLLDVAPDGRALVSSDAGRAVLIAQSPDDRQPRDLSWLDLSVIADLSLDGKLALISEQSSAAPTAYAALLRPMDGGPPVDLGAGGAIALSPDGQWVVGLVEGAGDRGELVLWPTGPGQRRTISQPGLDYTEARFFPDSQQLLVLAAEAGRKRRFYRQPLDGSAAPTPLTREGDFSSGFASPDGTQLATMEGDHALWLFPLVAGGGDGRRVLELDDEVLAGWTDDRNMVWTWRRGERPAQVFRVSISTGKRYPWRSLDPPDPAGLVEVSRFRATPDGRAHAYTYFRMLSNLYLVEGLR